MTDTIFSLRFCATLATRYTLAPIFLFFRLCYCGGDNGFISSIKKSCRNALDRTR
ncbi:unnamed protein product [Callosobruchus maculatus]|uniref:Uncharacterized protein n=1 Tax=Callosobruchus maculatus TaxID=64391 RepID=A0A653DH51_CALMS|nr:unnamed protein product [Callosobruchus maculatus]